jgi:hypothetical protein
MVKIVNRISDRCARLANELGMSWIVGGADLDVPQNAGLEDNGREDEPSDQVKRKFYLRNHGDYHGYKVRSGFISTHMDADLR